MKRVSVQWAGGMLDAEGRLAVENGVAHDRGTSRLSALWHAGGCRGGADVSEMRSGTARGAVAGDSGGGCGAFRGDLGDGSGKDSAGGGPGDTLRTQRGENHSRTGIHMRTPFDSDSGNPVAPCSGAEYWGEAGSGSRQSRGSHPMAQLTAPAGRCRRIAGIFVR